MAYDPKLIIYNEGQIDQHSKLALTSPVHVICKDSCAYIVKDRSCGLNFTIHDLSAINTVLKAIYPYHKLTDLRAA